MICISIGYLPIWMPQHSGCKKESYICRKLDKELTTGGREEAITKVRAFLFYMCEHGLLSDNNTERWKELFKHRFVKSPKIPSVYTPQRSRGDYQRH